MEYISTRGFGPIESARAITDGIAPDGGLYVPTYFPSLSIEAIEELTALSYAESAGKRRGVSLRDYA
jgi:threonine synthase